MPRDANQRGRATVNAVIEKSEDEIPVHVLYRPPFGKIEDLIRETEAPRRAPEGQTARQ